MGDQIAQHQERLDHKGPESIHDSRWWESGSALLFWWPVVGVAALLVIPILWLLFARWIGVPFTPTSDSGGLLATIGGAMGAIFTVGGLVIALVAILTQISLQDRIKRVTRNARREFEKKYEQDLRSMQTQALKNAEQVVIEKYERDLRNIFEKQINQQVEAYVLFRDAQGAMEAYAWEKAENLIRQALKLYPALIGARSLLGIHMCEAVSARFKRDHGVGNTVISELSVPFPPRTVFIPTAPTVSKTIDWLDEAIQDEGDAEGQVWAALALMCGVHQDYDKMLDALQKALQLNEQWRSTFQDPDYLILLLHGCEGSQDKREALQTLAEVLKITIPLPREQVIGCVPAAHQSIGWLVMDQPQQFERGASLFPMVLWMVGGTEVKGEKTATVRYSVRFYPKNDLPQEMMNWLPAEELVNDLFKRFLFVSDVPNWWSSY